VTRGDRFAGSPAQYLTRIGGKGVGLLVLSNAGLEVPAFFVVETSAWRPEGPPPEGLRDQVAGELAALGERVAVRSSAVGEDSAGASFAGQLESVLGARGLDEVMQAIRQCWRSGDSERVRAYRALHGLPKTPVAVVVQAMLTPDAAGVLFTRNPDDPLSSLISASWGLGIGVVQGSVDCDTWNVGPRGTECQVEPKPETVLLGPSGPESGVVPKDRVEKACLTDAVVQELVATGRKIEELQGKPQDIEFAVVGQTVHYLQTRPITVPIPSGRRLLWDNSNIVESFSGPTTPMTFSFAHRAYTIIYQLFSAMMGVSASTIEENQGTFHRMVGLLRGRVYYNLNAWYMVISLLPGFQMNRKFMEQMMGVAEVASDEDALQDSRLKRAFVHGPRTAWMLVKLLWRLVRLDADIARFRKTFDAAYREHRVKDLDAAEPFELLAIYHDLERRLLWSWTPPIVNDFFVMIFYGLLRSWCQKLTGDPATNLHNELLAGEGGLESTEPTMEALRIADLVLKEPGLLAVMRSDRTDSEVMEQAQAWGWFSGRLATYLDLYGDRCVDELKLEVPSLRQRPEFLIAALRNYVREGAAPIEVDQFGVTERRMRKAAEVRVWGLVGGWKERLFQRVLSQTRLRVKERENLRFARTRIFGLVRDLVRAMGLTMVRADTLDEREDVFWLTMEECLDWIRGTAVTTNLRGLVALRRAEFAEFEKQPAPSERFHTLGAVYAHNRFKGPRMGADPVDGVLSGIPCCPGVVEGPIRVLEDPSAGGKLCGEILVAERTDPGWVPLYPSVSGILVERGSVLSHSAVVARELGIPTVVGIRGLTEFLADGDWVRMDGGAGTVERLEATISGAPEAAVLDAPDFPEIPSAEE
jgi:pyruvate,water dikinase